MTHPRLLWQDLHRPVQPCQWCGLPTREVFCGERCRLAEQVYDRRCEIEQDDATDEQEGE